MELDNNDMMNRMDELNEQIGKIVEFMSDICCSCDCQAWHQERIANALLMKLWHNPQKELPPKDIDVLIMVKDDDGRSHCEVRYMDEYDKGMMFDSEADVNSIPLHMVMAWMVIPRFDGWR